MLKKELELLEFEENTPPLLNELYVVVSNKNIIVDTKNIKYMVLLEMIKEK